MEPEIYVDTSEVPPQIRNTALFRADLLEMRSVLSQKSKVTAFCIHEAGHYVYFLKMGVSEDAFTFRGPRFRYVVEGGTGKVRADMAVIKPDLSVIDFDTFEKGEHVALGLAKAAAAGGAYTMVLAAEKASGDEYDRRMFHAHFRHLCEIYPESLREAQEQDYWDKGRAEVLRDLRSPKALNEAWATADWLRPRLFPAQRLIPNSSNAHSESAWKIPWAKFVKRLM